MKRAARVPSQLPESLHRRLNAYALAASAAGVGVLALAQPAEGRIVYTPTHKTITFNQGILEFDVNNDGTADFKLIDASGTGSSCAYRTALLVSGFSSHSHYLHNAVVGSKSTSKSHAAALRAGVRVGTATVNGGIMALRAQKFCTTNSTTFEGAWANNGKGVRNRYLGLKFYINKQVHYGWARLNVDFRPNKRIHATLTGYAYETIPNKPIITGKTKGSGETGTLGALARGAK